MKPTRVRTHRIGGVQPFDCELPSREVAEEAALDLPVKRRREQVGDLRDDSVGTTGWLG